MRAPAIHPTDWSDLFEDIKSGDTFYIRPPLHPNDDGHAFMKMEEYKHSSPPANAVRLMDGRLRFFAWDDRVRVVALAAETVDENW